jgi:sn-glycerol 3-phosphate transport system permease protein
MNTRAAGLVTARLLTLLASLLWLAPYAWMALTSLKPLAEITSAPLAWWPRNPSLDAYREVAATLPVGRYFLTTTVMALLIALTQITLALPAGYALAKLRFRGKNGLFLLVIGCLLIPGQVTFVPVFLLLSRLGLVNTMAALVLPFAVSAFGTFLVRQALLAVPDEIIEAARLDGASEATIIYRILGPILTPTLTSLFLLSFVFHWNDYFWPLVMTTDDAVRTLPLGVALFREQGTGVRWHLVMAANVVLSLPALALFAVAQRHLLRAVAGRLRGRRGQGGGLPGGLVEAQQDGGQHRVGGGGRGVGEAAGAEGLAQLEEPGAELAGVVDASLVEQGELLAKVGRVFEGDGLGHGGPGAASGARGAREEALGGGRTQVVAQLADGGEGALEVRPGGRGFFEAPGEALELGGDGLAGEAQPALDDAGALEGGHGGVGEGGGEDAGADREHAGPEARAEGREGEDVEIDDGEAGHQVARAKPQPEAEGEGEGHVEGEGARVANPARGEGLGEPDDQATEERAEGLLEATAQARVGAGRGAHQGDEARGEQVIAAEHPGEQDGEGAGARGLEGQVHRVDELVHEGRRFRSARVVRGGRAGQRRSRSARRGAAGPRSCRKNPGRRAPRRATARWSSPTRSRR